jgi:DNA-binding transcriptional ArsR family regulator
MNMGDIILDKIFKALADPTRVTLLSIISKVPKICLCDLQNSFTLSGSTLSRHLKDLHNVNLVEVDKIGKWKYYTITPLGYDIVKIIYQQSDKAYLQSIQNIINNLERNQSC